MDSIPKNRATITRNISAEVKRQRQRQPAQGHYLSMSALLGLLFLLYSSHRTPTVAWVKTVLFFLFLTSPSGDITAGVSPTTGRPCDCRSWTAASHFCRAGSSRFTWTAVISKRSNLDKSIQHYDLGHCTNKHPTRPADR